MPTGAFTERSPDAIASFFQDIILEYHNFRRLVRRSEPREPAAIPVQIVRLDEALEPVGEPFYAVTRDISLGGAGIFHHCPVDAHHVLLEFDSPFTDERLRLIAKVEHCTPCGKYFVLGCRFGV